MKKKTNKKRKGFTLIELIVVIAILAILAAVAVPQFLGLIDKANTATEVAAAAEYANAINIYNALNTTKLVQADLAAVGTADPVVITQLTTANLLPSTDATTDINAKVLARITINATTGVATVTNKDKI